MHSSYALISGAAACVVAAACSSSSPSPAASQTSAVTFHKDVEPIVQHKCQGCHVAGGIAPFPLTTYADAKPYAALMAQNTAAGIMPPWGAAPSSDCTPLRGWKEDARLSAAQIATIQAWNDQGALEGDPKDAPGAIAAPASGLSGMSMELEPPAAYTPVDNGSDQFRCFVLDPQLTSPQYVNGTFIVPGNTASVHHALVFADPNGASTALVTDPATNSYDCFGGPGFTQTSLVTAWAPGGVPIEYPSDVGQPIAAGSLLVMQVHYHPHHTGAALGPDQSKLQLRFTSSAPAHVATALLAGNFDAPASSSSTPPDTGLVPGPDDPATGPVFDIPAGVKGHTETMQITVPQGYPTVRLLGIAGHQHYVGSSVSITIARQSAEVQSGAPANECLLSIPRWDFNWQRFYLYDAPIDQLPVAGPGDVVDVKCTYDNTLDNALLLSSLTDRGLSEPQDVKLGETTLDEMCLGAFVFIR
jgi:Copper type II ascorbate-dependent monooxygenase, N-terminal domain